MAEPADDMAALLEVAKQLRGEGQKFPYSAGDSADRDLGRAIAGLRERRLKARKAEAKGRDDMNPTIRR